MAAIGAVISLSAKAIWCRVGSLLRRYWGRYCCLREQRCV